MSSRLRFILDFGPLIAFFLAYRFTGMLAATMALMAATAIALVVTYMMERKVAVMPLLSGIAVGVMGGLTLYLQDDQFIKVKPTIVNLVFAGILLVGLACRKPLLKYVLGHAFQLTPRGWEKLSFRWGLFFVFLALLNEIIWRHFSTDFWVNFKVFGMLTCTLLFTLLQVPLVQREWVEEKADEG